MANRRQARRNNDNEYAEILSHAPETDSRRPVLHELQQFCEGINSITQQKARCIIEPGFVVNLGQEERIILVRNDNGYKWILLRAYVPINGFPVNLDTYSEELIRCDNIAKLKEELKKFLRIPGVQEQIILWIG